MATHKIRKIDWSKYTVFQQKVYRTIMKIKPGNVLTYTQVARLIGKPKAARAVGNALAKNMDAPIIPCHRVVGRTGMGGYSARGGIRTKIKLLKQEGYTNV
jgi:methylated-DNA-[protein]-cysteine S-methyltransferase